MKTITMSEAREQLEKIGVIDQDIKHLEEQIRELREKATSTGISLNPDRVQTSPGEGTPNIVTRYLDLEREMQQYHIELEERKLALTKKIHEVPDGRHVMVLYERYVRLKTVETIAAEQSYSEGHVWRLHGDAIREFKKILENE